MTWLALGLAIGYLLGSMVRYRRVKGVRIEEEGLLKDPAFVADIELAIRRSVEREHAAPIRGLNVGGWTIGRPEVMPGTIAGVATTGTHFPNGDLVTADDNGYVIRPDA